MYLSEHLVTKNIIKINCLGKECNNNLIIQPTNICTRILYKFVTEIINKSLSLKSTSKLAHLPSTLYRRNIYGEITGRLHLSCGSYT